MTGQLITFPVRLYVRGARLLLHTAEDLTGRAVMSTLRIAGTLGNLRPGAGAEAPAPPASEAPAPPASETPAPPAAASSSSASPGRAPTRPSAPAASAPTPRPATVPDRDPRSASAPSAAPAPGSNGASAELASERLEREDATATIDLAPGEPEPEHVSEEPALVLESADPGAEEGVGAVINVREPWDGYDGMKARQVIARLSGASGAELAAVQLYESGHRKRPTVLQAVERELKTPGRE